MTEQGWRRAWSRDETGALVHELVHESGLIVQADGDGLGIEATEGSLAVYQAQASAKGMTLDEMAEWIQVLLAQAARLHAERADD